MKKMIDRGQYMPRLIDETVERYLETMDAICIEGPKWCGKTLSTCDVH